MSFEVKKGQRLTAARLREIEARGKKDISIPHGFSDGGAPFQGRTPRAVPSYVQVKVPEEIPPFSVFGLHNTTPIPASKGTPRMLAKKCDDNPGTTHGNARLLLTNDSTKLVEDQWMNARLITPGFPTLVRAPDSGTEDPVPGSMCGLKRGTYVFSKDRGGFMCVDKFTLNDVDYFQVYPLEKLWWWGRTTGVLGPTNGTVGVELQTIDPAASYGLVDLNIAVTAYCPPIVGGPNEWPTATTVKVEVCGISGLYEITAILKCPEAAEVSGG